MTLAELHTVPTRAKTQPLTMPPLTLFRHLPGRAARPSEGHHHRDLKPSNILVTLIDAKPVPKVIDFGVAKAIGGKLRSVAVHPVRRRWWARWSTCAGASGLFRKIARTYRECRGMHGVGSDQP